MYSKSLAQIIFAGLAVHAGTVAALFDCNSDQHAFDPTDGKFVVHYTSIRDSSYNDEPWVRICKPDGSGGWDQVDPLSTPCEDDPATHISKDDTGLNYDLVVTNGEGCDPGSGHGLNGASIAYNDQIAVLEGSNSRCGDRDHGVSCEFVY